MGNATLSLSNVAKVYGGLKAVNDITFSVQQDEIVGLIGPNGAGKTTLFNVITQLERPSSGKINFFDKNITTLKSYRIAQIGISRTFQNLRLFFDLTVIENIMMGCYWRTSSKLLQTIVRSPNFKKIEGKAIEYSYQLSEFVALKEKINELAKNLSYGEQRCVEIARALATKPKLILLDEPSAGMNPTETKNLMSLILKIRESGISVLIIEHDMRVVMGICDRIIVLDHGEVIAEGTPDKIRKDPKVISAYLGKAE